MPIYEYRCSNCSHNLTKLQKFSDQPLQLCPNCGKQQLVKQLSSSAFILKGGGWYVTDFKHNSTKKANATAPAQAAETSPTQAATATAETTPAKANTAAAHPTKVAKQESA